MKTPVHRPSSPTRRRTLQAGAAFTAAAPLLSSRAYAAWPDRPIRLVVPFGSGGPVDVVARLLQPALSDELKASMFIENKPGAAGNIGVGIAARAEPDGNTVLITSNTIVINPLLYKSVPYELARDFIPLVDIAGSPTAFTVNPKSGINSVAELIALAKQKPGGIELLERGVRDARASRRRVLQEPRRHPDDARAVQRRRACQPGRDCRDGRHGLRRVAGGASPHRGGDVERHRGDRREALVRLCRTSRPWWKRAIRASCSTPM